MNSNKKITKEDTWRPGDLKRYLREEEHGDVYMRRRDDNERKQRGGESIERRHREPEKESRREREKLREKEITRERRDRDKKDSYAEQRKEGSQDRRGDKERDRRDERDREKRRERVKDENKYGDDYREHRDRRQDREERHEKERDKERLRDKEKDRVKDRERHNEEDRDKRREGGDKERRREDREHRSERERRRHEERRDARRDQMEKHHREQRDDQHQERERHKNDDEDKRKDKEIRDRHRDREPSERREEREYKEEHRKHKEERERRHKEREHHDERRKHDSESREHRDLKGSSEEVRHHRGDRERADKERRHREEEDAERKHKERRHREDEDPDRDHKERRHREDEDPDRDHKERRHREDEDPDRNHKERRHREDEDPDRDHKERRHREDEDPDRNHKERTISKKSSSDKSHRPERDVGETEEVELVCEQRTADVRDEGDMCNSHQQIVNDGDSADQEYEDDFEDYEEDFEEMDESANEDEDEEEPRHPEVGEEREELTAQRRKEIEAIQRAMDEENERVGTAQSRQSASRGEEDGPKWSEDSEKKQSRASQRGKFIDFVAAKQRVISKTVATKQKKRSTELLRLIDLDFSVTFSLLDLPPVNEYEMYIRSFGTANTKQAYVQCNEDNTDQDLQTEEIEMCEKWTQHPPEHSGACGDPNLSQEARDKTMSEMNFDSQRLTSFLRSASQVMVVLLEEDHAERKSLRKLKTQTDTLSFSDGSLQLNTKLPFLYGRPISLMHFSQVQRHTMLSVHMATTKPSAVRLDSCTIICIWNIWETSRPQKILVYESEVQCCCFSSGKAMLVIAGTSVGSVVLWDLREHASDHYRLKIGEDEWTFRQPTFSTDAVMAGSGHFSSVTSIEVVPSAVAGGLRPEVPLLASEEESSGLSFQLASLDDSGVLNFWVVVELPKGNEAGSPTDLGLRPGGKVKLLHSSSHHTAERVSPRDAVKTGPSQTLLLKFLPTDSNHFFIGTNMGLVNHGTSHGLKAPPKCYSFQEAGVRPVDVSSIHFSPFRHHLFLVGCGDGSIRLHAVSHEQPVAEWNNSTPGEPVVSLQWAQTRPTVFCVLDAASNLHIWDLVKNDTQPVVTEKMQTDRVTAMAVFGDSGQQNTFSGIALAHESGKIEMQYFTRNFTVSTSAEEEKLDSMMTEAF